MPMLDPNDNKIPKPPGLPPTTRTVDSANIPQPATPEQYADTVRKAIGGLEREIERRKAGIASERINIALHRAEIAEWKRALPRKPRAKKAT